jgi:hypothetical protein
MAGVVLLMARGFAPSALSLAILGVASLLLIRTTIGAGWVLAGGAVVGLARSLVFATP